MNNIVNNRK